MCVHERGNKSVIKRQSSTTQGEQAGSPQNSGEQMKTVQTAQTKAKNSDVNSINKNNNFH